MVLVSPLDFDSLIDPEHAWKKSTDKFLESIGARVSNKSNKNREAVVAQRLSTRLMTDRSWV